MTTASLIGLTWQVGASSGGEPIIDYRIYYDQSTDIWIELEDGVATRTYTTSALLTKGRTYKIKVQARNSVGYGEFSSEVAILAAEVPAQPVAPKTTISALNVIVTWSTPDNGGSSITSYLVKARHQDGATYSVLTCTQGSADVVSLRTCTVPISQLIASPFSLVYGTSVFARITALNVYGSSVESTGGNGAIILTIPDAPVSLANNPDVTTGSQIKISWAQGSSNGGTAVIDFTISYKVTDGGSYSVIASAVTSQFYIAVGLTQGISYTFKVLARNAYGNSLYSSETAILAA